MKKTKFIMSAFLASVITVSTIIPVYASNISLYADKNLSTKELSEKYLTVSEYEKDDTSMTVYNNIDILKARIKTLNPGISDIDLAKQLHIAFGDSEDLIADIPEEKLLEILDCKKCIDNTNYVKATSDGSESLSKNQVLNELIRSENLTNDGKEFIDENMDLYEKDFIFESESPVMPAKDGVTITTSADGYMKITTRAYYLYSDEYRDYYQLRSLAEWLKFPICRFEDVLVVASDGNYCNDYDDYGYHKFEYTYEDGTSITTKNYISKEGNKTNAPNNIRFEYAPGSCGVILRFDLVCGEQLLHSPTECTRMRSFLYCKASLPKKDGYVQAAYCHAKAKMNISVSIPLGISFGVEGDSAQYYGEPLTIYYEGT